MRSLTLSTFLLTLPMAAWAAPDAAQTAAICQGRATCKIAKTYDGGRSASAAPLTVVEASLGLEDKPDEPKEGCHTNGNTLDGGREYWLIDGSAPPRQLLKLCNDGYGASSVGEDEVTVGPNRLVHWQTGGSAWRWVSTITYTLSPWRAVAERTCSYHNSSEKSGITTDLDFVTMTVRSIAKDSTKENDMGCPEWPTSTSGRFSPAPEPGVFGGYDIIQPALGDNAKVPAGTAIGDCVPAMTTAGVNGFIVYGKPAPKDQAAEVKVIAQSLGSLVVQVFDPTAVHQPAPVNGSWINLPHIEVWVGHNGEQIRTRLPLAELSQIGVDLSGRIYQGVGKKTALPTVERWEASDASGRPLTLLRLSWESEYALLNGVALVYSQADAGRQARLVSTTGIVNNRPLYVPSIVSLSDDSFVKRPGLCRIRDGRLSISD